MTHDKFFRLKDPNIQQCLEYLHLKITPSLFTDVVLKNRLSYIPEKHRELCRIQLKLEGLL